MDRIAALRLPDPSLQARTALAHLKPGSEAMVGLDRLTVLEAVDVLRRIADEIPLGAPGGRKAVDAALRLREFVHRSGLRPELRDDPPACDPRLALPEHYRDGTPWRGKQLARMLTTDFLA